MGGEICLPGVLGGDGSAAFVKEPGLAISASCKAPEAAWSFVRTLLTEEYQAGARSGLCQMCIRDSPSPEGFHHVCLPKP